MENYTDYNFYINTYKGNMPKNNFDRLVTKASMEVRKNIFNRAITGYENEVQMATCSVTDILLKIEELQNKQDAIISDKTVKSENVGGYSRTFEHASIEDIYAHISNQKAKIKEELKNYLLATGLLYRGV